MVPKYCFRVHVIKRPRPGDVPKVEQHSFDHHGDAVAAQDKWIRRSDVKAVELLMVMDIRTKQDHAREVVAGSNGSPRSFV